MDKGKGKNYEEEWYKAERDWSLAVIVKEMADELGRDATASELERMARSVRETGIPLYGLPF